MELYDDVIVNSNDLNCWLTACRFMKPSNVLNSVMCFFFILSRIFHKYESIQFCILWLVNSIGTYNGLYCSTLLEPKWFMESYNPMSVIYLK